MIKGIILGGEFDKIIARQKNDVDVEIGELLVADLPRDRKILLKVADIKYGSQITQQNLELISGLKLEEDEEIYLFDRHLRNYNLLLLKPVLMICGKSATACKELPKFFSSIRAIAKEDVAFLEKPRNAFYIGKLRSGSKVVDVDVALDGIKALTHHILISGTTGKGKSVLMKNLLWYALKHDYSSFLVFDPHDEYFGRNGFGLKDHPKSEKIVYYSINPLPGTRTLKINLRLIKPHHFLGVVDFSDAQRQAIQLYYKNFKENWIEYILKGVKISIGEKDYFKQDTLAVIERKLINVLDVYPTADGIKANGIFDPVAGESTIADICNALESGKSVIVDTSNFSGSVELLIGSMIAHELFLRYKKYKLGGMLQSKPVVSIVLEEAPRVLGKEVLEKGGNIFSTIAREGRKFKVGLIAITQLPSLIPKEILANMNTKIILGLEMKAERNAVIESASQDLSADEKTISSLDVGEAIVSSNFARFAIPVKIEDFYKKEVKSEIRKIKLDYSELS